MQTTFCRFCGAAMLFVKTEKGRAMPLDSAPNPAGNVVIERDLSDRPYARVLHKGETPGGVVYMPHFATCTRWPGKQRR